MLKNLHYLLSLKSYYGVSRYIDIAKGVEHIEHNPIAKLKQFKRRWLQEK